MGQYNQLLVNVENYLTQNRLLESLDEEETGDNDRQPVSNQKKHNEAVEIIRLIERFDSDAAIDKINELLKFRLDKSDRTALHRAVNQLNDYMFDEAAQTLSAL